MSTEKGISIVFVNSSSDNYIAELVTTHCHLLIENQQVNEFWHLGLLNPGQDIEKTTLRKLNEASIVIFILNANFLADEKYDKYIKVVEDFYSKGAEMEIYLIISNYCDWKSHKFLNKFRILPHSEKPILSNKWETKDQPFNLIQESINLNVQRIKNKGIKIINKNILFVDFFKLNTKSKIKYILIISIMNAFLRSFLTSLFKGAMFIWFIFIILALATSLPGHEAVLYATTLTIVLSIILFIKDVVKKRIKSFLTWSYFDIFSSKVINENAYSFAKKNS